MRYQRQEILPFIGPEGQGRLTQGRVLVIGAGGLGCPLLLYLVAAGVGTIAVTDGDTVDVTNLHRQVLFTESSIGKNKAAEAVRLLKERNSELTLLPIEEHLTEETEQIVNARWDVVVDCTDRLSTRYLIDRLCTEQEIPWVYAAIEGQEFQIGVFGLEQAGKQKVFYRDVFPHEGGAIRERFACSVHGVLGTDPGIAAVMQARETINILLGRGSVLAGKLLILNLETYDQYTISLSQIMPQCPG